MTVAVRHGLHAAPWRDTRPPERTSRGRRASTSERSSRAVLPVWTAALPWCRAAHPAAHHFGPLLRRPRRTRPAPATKRGLLAGMSMTEKQGGSDVRANTTRAVPVKGDGDIGGDRSYLLTGRQWFTSAPTGDLFLVLAQAPGGLSCFLLPGSGRTAP